MNATTYAAHVNPLTQPEPPAAGAGAWAPILVGVLALASVGQPLAARAQTASESALPDAAVFTPEVALELDTYVGQALDAFEVPGAALAVIEGGEIAYLGAFGVRGLEHAEPVDADTRFMVGSITKSMTATLLGTLVDDGLLDWDDPVVDHLPSFSLAGTELDAAVTLRQLLSHNTGVPRYDLPLFVTRPGPLELIDFVGGIEPVAAPGETFAYQNQVFALAGFAGASAAGAPLTNWGLRRGYSDLLVERVLAPAGMRRATPDLDAVLCASNHAFSHGYSALQDAVTPVAMRVEGFVTPAAPAGAVWASVEDMARYAALQVRGGVALGGERVISEATLATTHQIQVPLAPNAGYGLGWLVSEAGGVKIVEHGGGTAGFTASLSMAPELQAAVVVLTNRSGNGPFVQAVERYVTELILDQPHAGDADLMLAEEEARDVVAGLVTLTRPVAAEEVAALAGRYESDVRLFAREGSLVMSGVHGEFAFRALSDAPGVFMGVDNVLPGVILAPVIEPETGEVTQVLLGFASPEGEGLSASVALARLSESSPPGGAR